MAQINSSVRISTLRSKVSRIINGKLSVAPLPWPILNHLTQALFPGTSTVFCGSPGSAKSLMLIQALKYWHENDVPACAYMIEESREYHLMRLLAQHCGLSGLTEYDWISKNAETAEVALDTAEDLLHAVEGKLWANPTRAPLYREVAEWVEQRAKEGYRVICVDPVTKARPETHKPYIEEQDMLDAIQRITTAYNISCLLVTHPKQAFKGRPNMNDLAGGAAVSRFCQTILWVHKHDLKFSDIATPCGTESQEHNRTLHILKARNGKDETVRLAAYFDPNTLVTQELGVIVKKKKG